MKAKLTLLLPIIALLSAGCGGSDLDGPGLVRVSDHVYAFIAAGPSTEEGLGANAGFVAGSRGVLVVDARHTAEMARELLDAVRSVTDAPIRYLVYTHYHPDHSWGASPFAEEGALLLACPETGRLLEGRSPAYLEYYRQSAPRIYERLRGVRIEPPDSTVEDGATIELGGVEVVLRCAGPAHTAGDCLVAIPAERVIFSGGLVSNGYHPNLGDPDVDPEHWLEVLEEIGGGGYRHIVPGQGLVCGPAALDEVSAYITDLIGRCRDAIREGVPVARALQEISVPGASGLQQENIMLFNIQACYRREVLSIVRPPFDIDLPQNFFVDDGGGSTRSGRIHITGGGGLLQIETQWEPTSRSEIIIQDIEDHLARYTGKNPSLRMSTEGSKRLQVGGERALALHGSYAGGAGEGSASYGFWTWAMMVNEGTAYSFRLRAGDAESKEENLANLERLESILTGVEFR